MKNIITVICVFVFCFSCSKPPQKHYYDTGELKSVYYPINDSIGFVKWYYKNDSIEQEGFIRNDSILEGFHKMYYSDGVLHWQGYFKNSVIQGDYKWNWEKYVKAYYQGIEVEGHPKEFFAGNTYKFRIVMPEIHPQLYDVVDTAYNLLDNEENPDLYPYVFKFTKSGVYHFYILFMDKEGNFSSRNPRWDCEVDVKEREME
ncbi:hypothetical protein FACS189434_13450 [Bacteroidia bacterium]|nr:hypothetical protein FACS189434_13450 [Bacteroidia bacterium]